MDEKKNTCPVCSSSKLVLKYEASYVYSYLIDSDAPGTLNKNAFLPFMYDRREQKDIKQYIECDQCGTQFPCYFQEWKNLDAESIANVLNQRTKAHT